jgi:hypothetical protein
VPCRKLDERERRKVFVKEHGLIDYKSLQNKEKRKPKDERELIAKMRVFARFHSSEEHQQFIDVRAQENQDLDSLHRHFCFVHASHGGGVSTPKSMTASWWEGRVAEACRPQHSELPVGGSHMTEARLVALVHTHTNDCLLVVGPCG